MSWLPRALLEPRKPAQAILVGWATAFFPSILLSALSARFFPGAELPDFVPGWTTFVAVVLFSPLVETLIMAAVLTVLLRFVSPTIAVLLSALGWGIAHSLAAPAWGLTIWWPFLIFSTLFVTWRPAGWWRAVALVASVHMLQNLLPALAVLTPFAGNA